MIRHITIVGSLVALFLALSSFALVANAFDPGGPPGGGGIPTLFTGN